MNSKKTLDATNEFAHQYDKYIENCHWVGGDIIFGLMFDYIKPKQKLLDIGIGTGLSSKLFHQYGLKIYGIDGANEMIKITQKKKIIEEVCQADLTNDIAWFKQEHFDHAISHGVFHLIGNLEYIFKQVSRTLNKNGCFAFTYEKFDNTSKNYQESSIKGVYEKKMKESGIKAFKHSEPYILNLIETFQFQLLKKTEFLAFVDPNTMAKTYFNIIIAKR